LASPNIEGTSNADIVAGGGLAGFGAGFASYTTVNAPSYFKGSIYFDLTLNKLRVGGATAYETITSA
jgi:hypothetical protein